MIKKTIVLCLFVSLSLAMNKLDGEFLSGFESGLLVRNDARAFRDFNCETPESESAFLQQITQIVTPLKLAAQMAKQDKFITMIERVDTLVVSLNDMSGVFSKTYDGGDFCKGLIFGRDGA
jgi:hypothetical protein